MQFSRQLTRRGSNPFYVAIVQKPQYSFSTIPLPMSASVTTETLPLNNADQSQLTICRAKRGSRSKLRYVVGIHRWFDYSVHTE
jgi:hypothetical protein